MRNYVSGLVAMLSLAACSGMHQVDFEYYNLSTNRITVVIAGIRPDPSPGVLAPVHDENNRLERASFSVMNTVGIGERIKITWQESGSSHELELKREDAGVPAKLSDGRVRITYLGNGKWRVKRLEK